jgi:1-phosphofructokinase
MPCSQPGETLGHEQHTVAVLAPVLYLTVTIEASPSGNDEVHIHPGGQGFWIARMLKHLGERPLLCGPLGGESGKVFLGLLGQFGMDVSRIEVAHRSPVVINDRRSGERVTIADSPTIVLERHEMDDVYSRFLDKALGTGLCVVTGQSDEILPIDFYKRMGHDLAAGEVDVVADLHGPELHAFLEGGPIDILKVSDEDLRNDGTIDTATEDQDSLMRAVDTLITAGAETVVLSRQGESALARFGDKWLEAQAPELDPADHRGAGDSMTAGLAAGLRQGSTPKDTLRLACAAGAANVTRHGLGSADADLIPGLTEKVEIHQLSAPKS